MPRFDAPNPAPSPAGRLAAHYAAQLVAAAGITLLEPDDDHHYSSTVYDPDQGALVGQALPGGRRASLRLADLVLSVGDGSRPLRGATPEASARWLGEQLGQELSFPEWEMPSGPTLDQAALTATDEDLQRLAHWYAAAHEVLAAFEPTVGSASTLRVWPHHFDLATLVTLEEAEDPEDMRSVGLGMTPGDGGIAAPYLYVTPWPSPDPPPTPELPSGRWHTEGWYGAVLEAGDVRSHDQVAAFLRAAFAHCAEG